MPFHEVITKWAAETLAITTSDLTISGQALVDQIDAMIDTLTTHLVGSVPLDAETLTGMAIAFSAVWWVYSTNYGDDATSDPEFDAHLAHCFGMVQHVLCARILGNPVDDPEPGDTP